MANKRIKELAEKSALASGDYLPIDNENGTKKVNASQILNPISSAQSVANRADDMIWSSTNQYSTSKAYKIDDVVVYGGTLYKCIANCSAGSWSTNRNCFNSISLVTEVNDLQKYKATVQFSNISNGYRVKFMRETSSITFDFATSGTYKNRLTIFVVVNGSTVFNHYITMS